MTNSLCLARRKLQACSKGCRIAIGRLCGRQHEMLAAAPEDPIILIPASTFSLCRVRKGGMDAVRKAVLKIHLRSKLKRPLGAGYRTDFDVNMHSPAVIPARINREKLRFTLCIGELIAT